MVRCNIIRYACSMKLPILVLKSKHFLNITNLLNFDLTTQSPSAVVKEFWIKLLWEKSGLLTVNCDLMYPTIEASCRSMQAEWYSCRISVCRCWHVNVSSVCNFKPLSNLLWALQILKVKQDLALTIEVKTY